MTFILDLTFIDWLFILLILMLAVVAFGIDIGIAEEHRRKVLAGVFPLGAGLIGIIVFTDNSASVFFGSLYEGNEEARRKRLRIQADPREGRKPPLDASGSGDGGPPRLIAGESEEKEDDPGQNDLSESGDGRIAEQERKRQQGADSRLSGSFRDCDVCPVMVPVRPGHFSMGSAAGDPGHAPHEEPRRLVPIDRAFAIGRYEITAHQFEAFLKVTRHQPSQSCKIGNSIKPGRTYRSPGFRQDGSHPVVCITHADAQAYLRWLSQRSGRRYRLPSEAEWEYVARAGQPTPYATGDTIDAGQANFTAAGAERPRSTRPIGSYPPNQLTVHEMHGNVWELTEDCWLDARASAPASQRPVLAGDCGLRVMKGGAWYNPAIYLRTVSRWSQPVGAAGNGVGFRAAREMD